MLEELETANGYFADEKLFTPGEMELITRLYNTVPERDTLIHGSFHTHNIYEQSGELLLMNMADTSTGHPIFEIGDMYLSFIITSEKADEQTYQLIGLDEKRAVYFYNKMLELYLSSFTADDIQWLNNVANVLGYLRMIAATVTTSIMDNLTRS